jgi:hypothetical protein
VALPPETAYPLGSWRKNGWKWPLFGPISSLFTPLSPGIGTHNMEALEFRYDFGTVVA